MPRSRRVGLHRQAGEHRPTALVASRVALSLGQTMMTTTSPAPAMDKPVARKKPEPKPTRATENPVNVLLVDDDQRNLEVLETILECPDYRLVRAESAD